jgi:Npun R1517
MHSSDSVDYLPAPTDVGVYDCEVFLKFRLIEDKALLNDRERLLEMLLEAFSYGSDDFLEPVQVKVEAQEISETDASPDMRRQLIRLRNSRN